MFILSCLECIYYLKKSPLVTLVYVSECFQINLVGLTFVGTGIGYYDHVLKGYCLPAA